MKNKGETKLRAYRAAIFMFGVVTLLYLLNEHERGENYEECRFIILAIDKQNELFINSDKLPTHFSQIKNEYEFLQEAADNLGLKYYKPLKNIDRDLENLKGFIEAKKFSI